ncbi:MAG: CHAD domain-containing protein [Candidatus Obscuribacterales bacterium]|nr:CHAD domain-containing protein [Candidatus Obscuribacterales bacterium]
MADEKQSNGEASVDGFSAHLHKGDFIDYQYEVAQEALTRLWQSAVKLEKRKGKSEKRVHNMRVAFRRWYSIWGVLSVEGFESKSFKRKLGKSLKKAYKLLGAVRDWDVDLETAREFGVSRPTIAKWELTRDRVEKEANAGLERLELVELVKKLSKFIKKRAQKLRKEQKDGNRAPAQISDIIEAHLKEAEAQTSSLSEHAATLEELHVLRLSIKAWRYILVEFYGCNCEPLVEAQQLLGQINDLERVRVLLQNEDGALVLPSIERIVKKQQDLLDSLDDVKSALPYGLRPEIATVPNK